MADLQQYPLPNPGLPLGQQAVSPVAQTNPLQSLQQGGVQGFSLGLAARQQAALEQERQTQLLAAQAAAKAAQQKNMVDYLNTANEEFKTMADNNYAAAMDFYKEKMAPIHSQISQSLGMGPINAEEINHEDHPLKDMEEFNALMADSVAHPERASHNIVGMQEIANRPEIGKINREKIYKSMEITSTQNKQQSDLLQNAKSEFDKQLSNRSGGLGLQDAKINQAGHLRTMINQNSKIDPKTGEVTYKFPENIQGELVVGLANLVSGSNMSNVEEMKSLTPKTARGDLAHMLSYWTGAPVPETTQAFAKQLVDQIDRQGETAQQMRDTYHNQFANSIDPRLNQNDKQMLVNSGRGVRFEDYKNTNKTIQRKGKDGKVYTYTLNPKTGKYE